MTVDLHTHTLASDGTTTPSENAAMAARAGLRGLALTDHDTLAGWEEGASACARHGLTFVPGMELSAEEEGHSVHLLGYWVDQDNAGLVEECARLRGERAARAIRILELLEGLGVHIDPSAVATQAGNAPVGRPHIAAAMVAAGAVPDLQTAFDTYLADGGPAWAPKHALAPEDGVGLIRAAGGVAVLAHPDLGRRERQESLAMLDRLELAGLAGVEARHAGHNPDGAAFWLRAAAERELLATGSSDFHGEAKDVRLGASTTPLTVVEALRERAVAAVTSGGTDTW